MLRKFREGKKWTQGDLAKKIGVASVTTIHLAEKRGKLSDDLKAKLRAKFGDSWWTEVAEKEELREEPVQESLIGHKLKAYRDKVGWTQGVLAEKMGSNRVTINRAEKSGNMSSDLCSKADKAFGSSEWRTATTPQEAMQVNDKLNTILREIHNLRGDLSAVEKIVLKRDEHIEDTIHMRPGGPRRGIKKIPPQDLRGLQN